MNGGKRPRAGRKGVKIDLAELEKLCALQCTDQEISSFFNVSVRTIERRKKKPAFGEAMERGRAKGQISLRRSLWSLAVKGNPAANIFLAKNLLGYKVTSLTSTADRMVGRFRCPRRGPSAKAGPPRR